MPEPATKAPEPDAKKSHGLASYVVWMFLVVLVYVLSSGPVLRMVLKKHLSDKIMVVYTPLGWVYQDKLLRKPIGMYLHIWCPEEINTEGKFIND